MDPEVKRAIDGWMDFVDRINVIDRESFRNIEGTLSMDPVTTVIGPRRAGKSYGVMGVVRREGGVYVNFEDERFPSEPSFIRELHQAYPDGILALDEVHLVRGWERVVSSIHKERKIIVTGSTSHLLSREYGTFLTGRHITVEIFPLSFDEFFVFTGKDFEEYLDVGGYPEVVLSSNKLLLGDYLRDIVYRDILPRHRVDGKMLRFAEFLLSHSSKTFTERRLANVFSMSPNSVGAYLETMEHAFLLEKVRAYHPRMGARERLPFKVFGVDHGYISFFQRDSGWKGRSTETVIYWALRRKGLRVTYGYGREVDFLILVGDRPKVAINVTYELDEHNREREVSPLKDVRVPSKALIAVKGESKDVPTYRPWELDRFLGECGLI